MVIEQKSLTELLRCGHCNNLAPMEYVCSGTVKDPIDEERDEDADYRESGILYQNLRCLACNKISLRETYWHEDMEEKYANYSTLYPTITTALPSFREISIEHKSVLGQVVNFLKQLRVKRPLDVLLAQAIDHFETLFAASAGSSQIPLHQDLRVNGWLLHGVQQLLQTAIGVLSAELHQFAAFLIKEGAIRPIETVGNAYEPIRLLGSGGYGMVWLAKGTNDPSLVALKQCKYTDGVIDAKSLAALRREAINLQRLQQESIPKFIGCDFSPHSHYLAMEYVEGPDLDKWLASNPSLPDRSHVLRAILQALKYAHSLNICHRDLKNANILIASGLRAVVLDWGISKTTLPEQQTNDPSHLANLRTTAPECFLHFRKRDGRAFDYGPVQDIWSFGVIAYHVLSGKHPFEVPGDLMQTQERIIHEDPIPLPNEFGIWSELVQKLLDKNSATRFQNFESVLSILDRNQIAVGPNLKKMKFVVRPSHGDGLGVRDLLEGQTWLPRGVRRWRLPPPDNRVLDIEVFVSELDIKIVRNGDQFDIQELERYPPLPAD